MGFLSRKNNKETEQTITVNMNIGTVFPFTALDRQTQFVNFLAVLANNQNVGLKLEEQKNFKTMWNAFCMGCDAFDNLLVGSYPMINKDGIVVGFTKAPSTVENDYPTECFRTTVYYQSPDGNFAFQQHARNKDIILVYISEKISSRLLNALMIAEAKALSLRYKGYNENDITFGIPNQVSNTSRKR